MSPHYMAMRDGNDTTIPKNDQRSNPDYQNSSVKLKKQTEEKEPETEPTEKKQE